MAFFKDLKNSINDKLKEDMRTPLLQGEEIIDSQGGACSKMGMSSAFGGTIFFTNMRIVFETNKMNSMLKEVIEIVNNADVLEYCKADNVGLGNMIPIPGITKDKSVVIKTADSGYSYSPQDPDRMIQTLKNTCPNATLGEKSSYMNTIKSNFTGWKGSSESNESSGNVSPNVSNNMTPSQTPEASNPIEEIKKYKELLDMGIITQEEFDAKKKALLNL